MFSIIPHICNTSDHNCLFAYLDILSQDIHQKLVCGKIKGVQVLGQMTINPFISTEDIKQVVDKKFNQNSKIRRFHSSVN